MGRTKLNPSQINNSNNYVSLATNTTTNSTATIILTIPGTNLVIGATYQVEATVLGQAVSSGSVGDFDMYLHGNGSVMTENIQSPAGNSKWVTVSLISEFTYTSGDLTLTGNSNSQTISSAGTKLMCTRVS